MHRHAQQDADDTHEDGQDHGSAPIDRGPGCRAQKSGTCQKNYENLSFDEHSRESEGLNEGSASPKRGRWNPLSAGCLCEPDAREGERRPGQLDGFEGLA